MMIRSFYAFLIKCHPRQFRDQFEEQMLSVFDEAVRHRSCFRLLIDAAISVLRQWLLRSEYWSRPEVPGFGGGLPSLHEIHRASYRLQKKAKRTNLAWVLSILPVELAVAVAVKPTTYTFGAQMVYTVLPIAILFSLYQRCSTSENPLPSIQYRSRAAQTALADKRDALEKWFERMGLALVLSLTIWSCPVLIAGLLIRSTQVMRSWAFVNAAVFGIETIVFFTAVSRPNRRALTALEQEIEATRSAGN